MRFGGQLRATLVGGGVRAEAGWRAGREGGSPHLGHPGHRGRREQAGVGEAGLRVRPERPGGSGPEGTGREGQEADEEVASLASLEHPCGRASRCAHRTARGFSSPLVGEAPRLREGR